MKKEKRSLLYSLLLAELGDIRPSWSDLRSQLEEVAKRNAIDFTWEDTLAEATSLANEFSTLLDTLRLARQADANSVGRAGVLALDKQQFERQYRDSMFDFTEFLRSQESAPLIDIAQRFRRFALGGGGEEAVASIDLPTAQRLLDRIAAQPFTSPRAFITDPVVGVLDNEQLTKLYRQGTGA